MSEPTVRIDPRVSAVAWHFVKVNAPDADDLHQAAMAFRLACRIGQTINEFVHEMPR